MGFFNKLSENLHHGGVKVTITTPGSVSTQDPAVPVGVTLVASEQASIKSVRAEILATPMNVAFNPQGETQAQMAQNQGQIKIVALSELPEPFVMAPGETKTLQMNIVINSGNYAADNATSPAGSALGGAIGKLETLNSLFDPGGFRYSVKVTADVEGVALNPSDTVGISINKPGQFGSTTNIRL